jgi:hypothetical protein
MSQACRISLAVPMNSQIALDEFVRTIRNNPKPMSDEAILQAASYAFTKNGKDGALRYLEVLEAMIEFTDPSYHGKISAGAKRLLECDRCTVDRVRDTFIRLANAIKDLL